MTYPEDVLKAGREAAIGAVNALHWGGLGIPETCRARTESGQNDHSTEVQAAARAIMAERGRCAAIAKDEAAFHARRILGMRSGRMRGVLRDRDLVCRRIERAILGQQETGDD